MTIRDELAAGIISRGGKLIEKGKKRWKFSHYSLLDCFIWLGASGSARVGNTVENSTSLTDTHTYKNLRAEGQVALMIVSAIGRAA